MWSNSLTLLSPASSQKFQLSTSTNQNVTDKFTIKFTLKLPSRWTHWTLLALFLFQPFRRCKSLLTSESDAIVCPRVLVKSTVQQWRCWTTVQFTAFLQYANEKDVKLVTTLLMVVVVFYWVRWQQEKQRITQLHPWEERKQSERSEFIWGEHRERTLECSWPVGWVSLTFLSPTATETITIGLA